jgi:hypothetical protein
MKKGATFPTHLLFDSESEDFDVDEEFYSYDIRGTILDNFGEKLKLDVSEYADWKNIEAKNFEEQEISNEDLNDDDFMEIVRMEHLKYLSEYLQNFGN